MSRISLRFVPVVFAAAFVAGCTKVELPDPCALITVEEIRRIAPEVTSANAEDASTEGVTIKTCVWRNASDVEQIRLTSKTADGKPAVDQLRALMRAQPTVRVAPVPSIAPDAAAAFYPLGEDEITSMLIAQNEKFFLDLRPVAAGIRGEKSQSFLIAATLLKSALERGKK